MSRPRFKDYQQGRQQSLLPLNIESLIPQKHLVRKIDEIVDKLNIKTLHSYFSEHGASAYHPKMMLKLIVYAYSTKNYSCRTIEALLKQDVTYMWLSGMQTPDFNTINRFRSVYLKDSIEEVFSEVLLFLKEYGYIKFENYFIDGTKLEADAGKYSHVWRKNTERYKAAVQQRVKVLMQEIDELNIAEAQLPGVEKVADIDSSVVENLAQKINKSLEKKQLELTKRENNTIKSKLNHLSKEKEKLQKYEQQEQILGDRNSYSKTDTDATMMRMKGTDELRPGYNAQVSSENQFVVNYTISQNASDSADFVAHIEKIEKRGEEFLPAAYNSDAGYGSEENYEKLERLGITNYLQYSTFYKERTGEIVKNQFNKQNFAYNKEADYYTCPQGRKMVYIETKKTHSINGFEQTIRKYECEDCSDCPLKSQCTKATENRTMQVNENLERHKNIAYRNLTSEEGKELRKRRGWEIETFFGDLKHNQNYERIRLRGKEKAELELGWLSIAYNLRKVSKSMNKTSKNAA